MNSVTTCGTTSTSAFFRYAGIVVCSRGAEQDGSGAGEPGLVGGVQGHGTDEDEASRSPQRRGQRRAEVHVEPVAVQRADVEDHRPDGQVVGPRQRRPR